MSRERSNQKYFEGFETFVEIPCSAEEKCRRIDIDEIEVFQLANRWDDLNFMEEDQLVFPAEASYWLWKELKQRSK